MRLLLVEDDPELAKILESGFREQGIQVARAATTPAGRAEAAHNSFDVIVLDVMLPGGSGLDLCRDLRGRGVEIVGPGEGDMGYRVPPDRRFEMAYVPALRRELAPAADAALKTLAANLERAYPVEQKDQTFVTAPLSRFSISDDPPDDSQFGAIAPMLPIRPARGRSCPPLVIRAPRLVSRHRTSDARPPRRLWHDVCYVTRRAVLASAAHAERRGFRHGAFLRRSAR